MDENKDKIHISETNLPHGFTLDDILAEFGSAPDEAEELSRMETLGDRSKKLVMEQLPDGVDALGFSSLDDVISDAVADARAPQADDADAADESTGAFAAAGFEMPSPEPGPFDDRDAVVADALMEFGSIARQAEAEAEAALAPPPEEPPQPEEAEARPEPDAPADDAEAEAPEEPDAEAPGFEEEVLRFDDPEAVIAEALREYGSAAEIRDDDGSTAYASAHAGAAAPEEAPEEADAPDASDADGGEAEAEPDAGDAEEAPKKRRDARSAKERFLSPFTALLALIALRRAQREAKRGAGESASDAEADALPEPPPEKAAHECAAQLGPLRMRGRIATAMSLILVYLTYAAGSALPLTGALKASPRVLCLMLLILELTVMMAGLNVFTDGVLNLIRKKPDAHTLVACSCIITVLDAAVLALRGDGALGLPLCAAGALSMTLAIWGEYWRVSALRRGFKVLTSSRNLYTVSGEQGITKEVALLKSRRSIRGFIRRSIEPDYTAGVFKYLTPLLLAGAVVLGALAALVRKTPGAIVHDIAMLLAASAAFSATICFSLPYAFAARRFTQTGAAVAGWPGIRDIGRSRSVVITDADVFPKGTLEMGDIRILEGAFVDKVISATASVIAASGSGLAVPFAELIRRNGYSISRVENFEPHDGGGMTAMVNGENIAVGNTGFMNLIGVRVPRKLSTHNAVCTAMNGSLVGIFMVNYRATGGVQDALVTLLHSNLEPVFALRDFNITPQMLKNKFRLPADNFKFPSYSERFRISGAEPDAASRVAAAIAREGMEPLVDAADRGRRLYSAIRIGTLITAVGCVFGLLMMFLMSWTGGFAANTAGNVITFMLLWLIPSVVITWGVSR